VLRGDGVRGHDGGLGHNVWWTTVRHARDWGGGIHYWCGMWHIGCPIRHLGCSPSAWSLQAALMDHGNAAGWRMTVLERRRRTHWAASGCLSGGNVHGLVLTTMADMTHYRRGVTVRSHLTHNG